MKKMRVAAPSEARASAQGARPEAGCVARSARSWHVGRQQVRVLVWRRFCNDRSTSLIRAESRFPGGDSVSFTCGMSLRHRSSSTSGTAAECREGRRQLIWDPFHGCTSCNDKDR